MVAIKLAAGGKFAVGGEAVPYRFHVVKAARDMKFEGGIFVGRFIAAFSVEAHVQIGNAANRNLRLDALAAEFVHHGDEHHRAKAQRSGAGGSGRSRRGACLLAEPGPTITTIARLIVPRVTDLCAVDIMEGIRTGASDVDARGIPPRSHSASGSRRSLSVGATCSAGRHTRRSKPSCSPSSARNSGRRRPRIWNICSCFAESPRDFRQGESEDGQQHPAARFPTGARRNSPRRSTTRAGRASRDKRDEAEPSENAKETHGVSP